MKFDSGKIAKEIDCWWSAFCLWAPGRTGAILRSRLFRRKLKRWGENISVSPYVQVSGWGNISIGDNVGIGASCIFESSAGTIDIGRNSAFNARVILGADFGSIKIGENVIVGMNVTMRASGHRTDKSPDIAIREQGHMSGDIVIEDDVWIGANAVILPNVRICSHSVIGAGAVVTKDVPAGSVAAGVPAKVIKSLS